MNELLQSIKADLASRRLLPVLVLVSIGLLAAVAYAATGSGSSGSPAPTTPAASTPSTPTAGSVPVSVAQENPNAAVSETPGGLRYQSKAPERNPFTPIVSAATSASSTGASSGKGAPGSAPSHGSSSPGSSTGGQPTGKGTAPAPAKQPPAKTAPKPSHGLAPTQSYTIALSLTNPGGNLDAIESLERLSALPSEQEPLLVYLGVLEGGRHALFAVPPGTVVSGPGACTPGPTDCEILSLSPNQIESLSTSAGVNVALFTVTAIKVESHPTVASANRARTAFSTFGNTRLDSLSLPALALFEYQPAAGVAVDLRNLAVGGEK